MTSTDGSRIFITGGSGFVGTNIIEALGDAPIRTLTHQHPGETERSPNRESVEGDVTDVASLSGVMDGCDMVIHLVAIIEESGGSTFDAVIRRGTENVIAEARNAGVTRFIQMSAIGARNDPSFGYLHAKWQAEEAVKRSGLNYTIFRPSVIFGPGDGFINTLAGVVKSFPVIPVVGDGSARFQPVHVEEVAACFRRAVTDPDHTANETFELGGGKVYTYAELIGAIAKELGTSKPRINVPVGLMKPVVRLSSLLPKPLRPPVTMEQLKMLALHNTTDQSSTSDLIGREPIKLEDGLDYIR